MNPLNRFFAGRSRSLRHPDFTAARRRRTVMSLESLEGRQLLTAIPPIVVNTIQDTSSPGVVSLREAINETNAASSPQTIDFAIASGGVPLSSGDGEYFVLKLNSPLPAITKPVTIDGTTEGNAPAGNPNIEISGSSLSGSSTGLTITGSNVTVKGLSIVSFGGGGVKVSGSQGVTLNDDWVGFDPDEVSKGNGAFGVEFSGGANEDTLSRSVVSSNTGPGVLITGTGTQKNVLTGDFIGTTTDGTDAAPNRGDGVQITAGASYNSIGGTGAGQGNVISGNTQNGVEIVGNGGTTSPDAQHNVVQQDVIGLEASAATSSALPNGSNGVKVDQGASYNTIGGTTSAARNVISGNQVDGVFLTDSGTSYNLVEGNYIGTDGTGMTNVADDGSLLGNAEDGVVVQSGANFNTIGGTDSSSSFAGNVISGNLLNGVSVNDASYTVAEGNYIGLDALGMHEVGTQQLGVIVHNSSAFNTIGGTTPGMRNVISGNTSNGVAIGNTSGASDPNTKDNVVEDDYIGTNAAGTAAVGNGHDGVIIEDGATLNTIGSTSSSARTVISGNASAGVSIADASHNLVEGDYIGVDETGNRALGNQGAGVVLDHGSADNTVGGTTSGARNVISGNHTDGVEFYNSGTTGNQVEGDYIGVGANPNDDLGNGGNGVYVDANATGNTIGGTAAGAGNTIAFNAGLGILFVNTDNTQTDNTIYENGGGSVGYN
jgi:hypothetical protein